MRKIYDRDSFSAYVMGNYAIARAMLEKNVRVITTYPGSPTPEIADALNEVREKDFYFEYSVNEKVALEKAAGASLNGHLSVCFFKSVGLNVAADSFVQLPMMNLTGGLVVIIGDDPGANSSQNEQDNRHYARMSYIPLFEPSSVSEAYSMLKKAIDVSKKCKMPVLFRITTHISHAKEYVNFDEIKSESYNWESKFNSANGPYIPVAKTVFPLKEMALKKLEEFKKDGEILSLNRVDLKNSNRLIITSGLCYSAVKELIEKNNLKIDVLKLSISYPLNEDYLADIIKDYSEVFVIEELDRILEYEIKSICFDKSINVKIYSRENISDMMDELSPLRIKNIIKTRWDDLFEDENEKSVSEYKSFPRYPQLCPGCGHRSAFFAIKKAIESEDITVADIGCHTLGFFPPYKMGEILFSMGHSVSTGSGLALNNSNRKVIAFLGDSTMFHAALPGIVNASVYNSNVILVILENGTTAMTGHQPRIGTGEIGESIDIVKLLEAMNVKFIRKVDAYNQKQLSEYIKEAREYNGFSVIIAHHPCMLKYTREMKKKNPDYKPKKVFIDQNVCDRKMICVSEFACPSFVRNDDGSITVNHDLCIGDGSCIQTCPVKAIKPYREEK